MRVYCSLPAEIVACTHFLLCLACISDEVELVDKTSCSRSISRLAQAHGAFMRTSLPENFCQCRASYAVHPPCVRTCTLYQARFLAGVLMCVCPCVHVPEELCVLNTTQLLCDEMLGGALGYLTKQWEGSYRCRLCSGTKTQHTSKYRLSEHTNPDNALTLGERDD